MLQWGKLHAWPVLSAQPTVCDLRCGPGSGRLRWILARVIAYGRRFSAGRIVRSQARSPEPSPTADERRSAANCDAAAQPAA